MVFLVFLLLLLGFALCICGLLCGFVACCQEREMMGVHPIIYPKLVPCCPCKLSLVGWLLSAPAPHTCPSQGWDLLPRPKACPMVQAARAVRWAEYTASSVF